MGLAILILFLTTTVICKELDTSEDCVTHNFEDGIEDFSHLLGFCTTLGPSATWYIGNYTDINIESPHPLSTSFISPSETLSCITSFTFPISSLGVFEMNVYIEAYMPTDQLAVFVNEVVYGGNDATIGMTIITPLLPDYYHGWHTLTVPLRGRDIFEGYISLTGAAAEESIILVDSFRYIPSAFVEEELEEECVIYADETDPTTPEVQITTTTEIVATEIQVTETNTQETHETPEATTEFSSTTESVISETLITDMNTLTPTFATETDFTHTETDITSTTLDPKITDTEYTTTEAEVTEIYTLEQNVTNTDYSTTETEAISTTPHLPNTDNTEFTVTETEITEITQDQNVTNTDYFTTVIEIISTTPQLPTTGTELTKPETEITITTPQLPNTVTESTDTETEITITTPQLPNTVTESTDTETEIISTTPQLPYTVTESTETEIISTTPDNCITYNFEDGFDTMFGNDFGICTATTFDGIWSVGTYSTISIDPPHNASATFISPSNSMSCTSSFEFLMASEGLLEVHIFMQSAAMTDQVHVFVNRRMVDTTDVVLVASLMLLPLLPGYEDGWHILRANILGTGSFDGYVTLLGQAAEGSTVLIDAFRYIPPSTGANGEQCIIYEDESSEEMEHKFSCT